MERYRVDHWLNLCCVYKQRAQASRACESGHVKINGQRAKPAAAIKIGDTIEITGTHERKLVILDLPQGNISKEQAREMYRDETPPPPPRDSEDWLMAAMKKAPARERGAGRPTKKDRRRLEGFQRD